jgi:signal transduction histidine kinase
MELSSTESGPLRSRDQWLIRLRWVAILSVLLVVTIAGPVLELVNDARPLYALVSLLAIWNLVLAWRERRGYAGQPPGQQVTADLAFLGALLFFSGGLRNPFSVFLVVQLILGSILLDARTIWRIGAIGGLIAVLLGLGDHYGVTMGAPLPKSLPSFSTPLAICATLGIALYLCNLIMQDLRDRSRQAEESNTRANLERNKLSSVLQFAGAAVLLLDYRFHPAWQNDRAYHLLGPIDPTQPFRLKKGPDLEFARSLAPQTSSQVEWATKDASGIERFHLISVSRICSPRHDDDQWVLVFADVTDRRLAERHLHRTEKLAALGRLAAGVAHEINTPLGSVAILSTEALTDAEAAIQGDREAAKSLREQLLDIKSETDRMTRLVRRLLDLSHPEGDATGSTRLSDLVRDSARLATLRSPGTFEQIRMEIESEDLRVSTDSSRFKQVLINVIDNAIHATSEVKAPICVRVYERDGHAVVEVQDQGYGISEEDLPKVFEPFFTTKDVGEGTGLGLYVSYEIMKNLGGEVALSSQPGKGTTARISLPLTRESS